MKIIKVFKGALVTDSGKEYFGLDYELTDSIVEMLKENTKLKQALNEVRDLSKRSIYYYDDGEEQGYDCEVDGLKIKEIIDEVLGDEK